MKAEKTRCQNMYYFQSLYDVKITFNYFISYIYIIDSMDMNLSKLWEIIKDREAWHAAAHGLQRVGHDWATELNWVEWNIKLKKYAITITNFGKCYKGCMQGVKNWIGDSTRKFWFEKWSESWEILVFYFFLFYFI